MLNILSQCHFFQKKKKNLYKQSHLIALRFEDYNHLEGCPLGEGCVRCSFLLLPLSISKAVQVDVLTKARIELESDVILVRRTRFKIYFKTVKKENDKKYCKCLIS